MTLIERAFNAFKFTLRIKKMLSVRSFINKLFININALNYAAIIEALSYYDNS